MQLANQDESIRSDYRSFSFESRFSEFENDTARSEAIETELERIDDRIRTLRDREREAATAHADHNASETVVTRALARNYYEALELRQALEELETHAESVDDQSVPVRDYTAELGLYTSPLREEISERLHGVDDSERAFDTVLLETSQDGLVLSAIDTDTKEYVREATRYDNRDLNRSDQIETIRTARDTAVDLYPWAFESTSGTSSSKYGAVQLYRVEATAHPQGRLTVYLDGGTGTVSHERQTLDFDQIPPPRTSTSSERRTCP